MSTEVKNTKNKKENNNNHKYIPISIGHPSLD